MMRIRMAGDTDVGIVKETNQDSLLLMQMQTAKGPMALAVLCDGMGGLSHGELASAEVIRAFSGWAAEQLPALCTQRESGGRTNPSDASSSLREQELREQWEALIRRCSGRIHAYAAQRGARMGTTAAALLLTERRYFILNVGDSRIYEISDELRQLTRDQTFVAREVAAGRMTPEEAETDPRRNVLLQGIGTSAEVVPDFFVGDTRADALYLLCSDGFRHELTGDELLQALRPEALTDEVQMQRQLRMLIDLNKERQERDNITAALVSFARDDIRGNL